MELVQLLDSIKLPFELPLLLHPPIVHFAIAIPIVVLLLEFSNLFVKRKCVGVISSLLLLLATLIYFAAFFAGKTDGSEAYSLLSSDGQKELKAHKLLGIYLVYGISALFLIKLIFAAINNRIAKIFFVILLAVFVGFTLKQGKDGGELVYEYGANVKAVSTMDDKIMELEDKLDSCKSELEKAQKTSKAKETAKAEEIKQQPTTAPASTSNAQSEQTQSNKTQPNKSQSNEATEQSSQPENETTKTQNTIEEKAKEVLEQFKAEESSSQTNPAPETNATAQ